MKSSPNPNAKSVRKAAALPLSGQYIESLILWGGKWMQVNKHTLSFSIRKYLKKYVPLAGKFILKRTLRDKKLLGLIQTFKKMLREFCAFLIYSKIIWPILAQYIFTKNKKLKNF